MSSAILSELISRAAEAKVKTSKYGYTPSKTVAIIFLVLFGLSTATHLGQAIHYRMWWLLPTACLCGIGELAGWGGRFWSSFEPTNKTPYMIQITTTIIAPTPLIAVSFILLGRIVERLGPCYSRISPRWYSRIFLSCDMVALVVQGFGGGLAASADDEAGANRGGNIMLGGIIFQFVAIVAYSYCAYSFLRHHAADVPVRRTTPSDMRHRDVPLEPRVKQMITALAFSTAVLTVRSIYRIVELATGWHGVVIRTQIYFNIFDGAMVVLAICTLNVAHPGRLLGSPRSAARTYTLPTERFRPDSPSFPASVLPVREVGLQDTARSGFGASTQTLIGGPGRREFDGEKVPALV
ncbi:RTA1-domain-containing protein [Mycena latifolia]|nr:RTA1-domain-containing protein [Mycena latifolia]